MAKTTPISRSSIRNLIAKGQLIVISEQRVLRLDAWAARHPGGRLPILHMVGKDASDQIVSYHSTETVATMARFQIGVILEPWVDMEPPISTEAPREKPKPAEKDIIVLSEKEVLQGDAKKPLVATLPPQGNTAQNKTTDHYIDLTEKEEIERAVREYPSLDPKTQQGISQKFRQMQTKAREQGLYICDYTNYALDACRYGLLFGLFYLALTHGYYLTSAVFLGCFWQQIMFVAHDAGHLGITHDFTLDTIIGVLVADLCCGLSVGWWKSSHNVHHLVPNHPKHDPDIQNVPLLATSPTFFSSIRSTYYDSIFPWDASAAFFVRFQHYSYYPIMFVARFNLYALSWQHLLFSLPVIRNRKVRTTPTSTLWVVYLELSCMAIYWYLCINLLISIPTWTQRVLFVFISHGISLLLHVQITLSHFGMSTADLGPTESFAQKQLRTTMDVDCPAWLDWLHGGLQFQVIHHLFPRMPKHNYREAQKLVKQFCAETGIKYTIFGFVEGNKVVLGRLEEIAKQVGMLRKCQQHLVEECFQ